MEQKKESTVGIQKVLDHTDYKKMFEELRAGREEGVTKNYAFLQMMLKSMHRGSEKLEQDMLNAMRQDIRSDEALSYLMSLHPFKQELRCAIGDLKRW